MNPIMDEQDEIESIKAQLRARSEALLHTKREIARIKRTAKGLLKAYADPDKVWVYQLNNELYSLREALEDKP